MRHGVPFPRVDRAVGGGDERADGDRGVPERGVVELVPPGVQLGPQHVHGLAEMVPPRVGFVHRQPLPHRPVVLQPADHRDRDGGGCQRPFVEVLQGQRDERGARMGDRGGGTVGQVGGEQRGDRVLRVRPVVLDAADELGRDGRGAGQGVDVAGRGRGDPFGGLDVAAGQEVGGHVGPIVRDQVAAGVEQDPDVQPDIRGNGHVDPLMTVSRCQRHYGRVVADPMTSSTCPGWLPIGRKLSMNTTAQGL